MDKTEGYLKDIAKSTAEIAKELKKMNRKPVITINDEGDIEVNKEKFEENSSDDELYEIGRLKF